MAMKLTKQETKSLTEGRDTLSEAAAKLAEAVEEYNSIVEKARGDVDEALSAYNSAREDFVEVVNEVANRIEEEYDNKSERWQESDKGQEAQTFVEWYTEFRDGTLSEDLEIEFPDALEFPDPMSDIPEEFPETPDEV